MKNESETSPPADVIERAAEVVHRTWIDDHSHRGAYHTAKALAEAGLLAVSSPEREAERKILDLVALWYDTGNGKDDVAHQLALAEQSRRFPRSAVGVSDEQR